MAEQKKSHKKRTAHLVSHTHWDREWRYPIWTTRFMLVDFIDELLNVLEAGQYAGFLLDGQCSPIIDYLEIRPENRPRIEKLVRDGKLSIGPWYTLPDEFPVDGEAMVRNLLWGDRISRQLGGVMKIGYTPFGWGQTAQLPQLYAGFGIDVAMIGKRVNEQRAPQCEFLWRGPDGTELLSTRFGKMGRHNFYFYVHLSVLFNTEHMGKGWEYRWENGGLAYHRADDEQREQDGFRLDAPARCYPDFITPEVIETAWKTMDESVLPDDRLMMNGCDYTAAQPLFPQMLERINAIDPDKDRQWVQTTMPAYVQLMREKIDRSKLKVVHGELRDGPVDKNTGNALSTRLYLKRLNKQAQNLLIRFAEPMCVAAAAAGAEYPGPYLRVAWENLLAAHPHDSINGVTQDKTAADVQNRLNQVIEISQAAGDRAMQELIRRIDRTGFADNDVLLVAFNPLPYPRREITRAWLDIPKPGGHPCDWPKDIDDPCIFDADGSPVPTQYHGKRPQERAIAELHTRAFPFFCDQHLLYFDTGEIPAGGYKVFRVGRRSQAPGIPWSGTWQRTGSLRKAPEVIENEFLRVTMNPNGTFNLTDKQRNRTYAGLNSYEDRGEHGNYWINIRPMFDQIHTSIGCSARIWCAEEGPLQATLISEVTLRIPKRGQREQDRRGDELEDLTIQTAVTLRAGAQQVEVAVEFENHCEDHYLRAIFPTGLSGADHVDAGGHFTVDHRPIHPQGPTEDTVWPDMATLPQNNFVDISDGKNGIAFLNDSLTEYEVFDTDQRVLALSLLRASPNWVCTETRVGSGWPSQKGGQCLGPHKIRYAIRPHAGDWNAADVPLHAEMFNVPLRLVQTRTWSGPLPGRQASLYSINNAKLRFSALKKTEDRNTFVFRLYNPTNETQNGQLRFAADLKRAWLTNLNEERSEELKLEDTHAVTLVVRPQKIITVELELK